MAENERGNLSPEMRELIDAVDALIASTNRLADTVAQVRRAAETLALTPDR